MCDTDALWDASWHKYMDMLPISCVHQDQYSFIPKPACIITTVTFTCLLYSQSVNCGRYCEVAENKYNYDLKQM